MKPEGTHIVINHDGGREVFKALHVVKAPMLQVRSASGENYMIVVGNYKKASKQEREAFENGEGMTAVPEHNRLEVN